MAAGVAAVAAVAVAPLATAGGAEIMATVTAIETASASAATASIVQFIGATEDRLAACLPYLGPRTRQLVEEVQDFAG